MTTIATKTTDTGAPALTSTHLNQSAVLRAEMEGKLNDIDRAILVTKTEMDGRAREKDVAIAEINSKFDAFMSGAVTHVADLEKCKLATAAALDVLAPTNDKPMIEADEEAAGQIVPNDQQSQAA